MPLPRDVIQGCELIDGRIVKKHVWDGEEMGMTPEMLVHAAVVRLIWLALEQSAAKDSLIRVFAEALFDVGADRSCTRRPDLAVMEGELPTDPEAVLAPLVPVMAVEVISPSNITLDVWDKVEGVLCGGGATSLAGTTPTSDDHCVLAKPGDSVQARRHHHRRTRPAWLRPPRHRPVPSTFRRFRAVTKARLHNPEPALAAVRHRGKSI